MAAIYQPVTRTFHVLAEAIAGRQDAVLAKTISRSGCWLHRFVIGAVGTSAATVKQDIAVAHAAIQAIEVDGKVN
jgi:uncharacterized protein GlcG (DUF336 family)